MTRRPARLPLGLRVAGRRLEAYRLGPADAATLVFLHEGLGSAGLWRDFPAELAALTGCAALVYSRAGYGASDPVPLPRPLSYMHDEALQVLPEVLAQAGVNEHILVGHSDGASIALIHAGAAAGAGLRGLLLEAPHVFAEEISIRSIEAAAVAWAETDLRARLGRWHGGNVDCAFLGWNQAWLDPAFRDWNIESYLPGIKVPLLLIQGEADEYGTPAQVQAIQAQAGAPAEVLLLPDCGHSPHRDQETAVLQAMARFVRQRLSST